MIGSPLLGKMSSTRGCGLGLACSARKETMGRSGAVQRETGVVCEGAATGGMACKLELSSG